MRSVLVKPENVHVKIISTRIKVMNLYLPQFPSPEISPVLSGGIIDIILGMILKQWVDMMVIVKIEPRNFLKTLICLTLNKRTQM